MGKSRKQVRNNNNKDAIVENMDAPYEVKSLYKSNDSASMSDANMSISAKRTRILIEERLREELLVYNQLRNIAISRFKYENAPDDFEPYEAEIRYFEKGKAVMFKFLGKHWIMDPLEWGNLNPNGYPTKFYASGHGFRTDATNIGVIGYSHSTKRYITPESYTMRQLASQIGTLHSAYMANLNQQQIPALISAPAAKMKEMQEMFSGSELSAPFIYGMENLEGSGIKIEKLDIKPEMLLEKLNKEKQYAFNRALGILGVSSLNDVYNSGSSTMSSNELYINNDQIILTRMSMLQARRDSIAEYNKMHGTEIEVYWNKDIESDNFYVKNSMLEQANLGLTGQGVTATPFTDDVLDGSDYNV